MIHQYNKTFSDTKSLYPRVFSVLRNLPQEVIYSSDYQPELRHPGAILNRATQEIVESMHKVLSVYNQFATPEFFSGKSKPDDYENMLKETVILLGHADSFIDECFIILKCLCPPPAQEQGQNVKFVYEWLKLNGFTCGATFNSYTADIKQYISFFTNRLKHGNQRLDGFLMKSGDIVVPGYYIQEVKGKQLLEIYPKLPSRYHKAVVGFSLNWTLKCLMLAFYEVCDALENTIKQHIKDKHSVKINTRISVVHDKKFKEVIEQLCQVGDFYFPYEYGMKFMRFRDTGDGVHISYPHGDKCPYPGRLELQFTARADGYSNKFPLIEC
ncbi:MAG: hypothetical protein H6755_07765 [Candidatus Omnitrophica bacterium]|nr:hypothetical protein [Candidatus Omnitrophota bacterium]